MTHHRTAATRPTAADVLEPSAPVSHSAHPRHRPHKHHRALTWVVALLSSALIVALVLAFGSGPSVPHLVAPSGSMAGDIKAANLGLGQDFDQLSAGLPTNDQLNEASLTQ
ncbi:MAG TPA: hypothetical protein VLI05_06575 [Candidatus Saccharimonadia bacterium]|nr:hypothetical protein [Candidatus Saccharimonadia bacterium]